MANAKRPLTVESLARYASLEVDDVLLRLWDGGIEYPVSPTTPIRPGDVRRAEGLCGVTPQRAKTRVDYWLAQLNMERPEFIDWAREAAGVEVGANARVLPKGGLKRLERAAGARNVLVLAEPGEAAPIRPAIKKPFVAREIGHKRDTLRHLTPAEIEAVHFAIARDFEHSTDPIAPAGVRSRPLLESAAGRPATQMFGEAKYTTVEMAAAALLHSIVLNHPFLNGNKRTALVAMLVCLDENGVTIQCDQNELFQWMIRVASHQLGADRFDGPRADVEVQLIAEWIQARARNTENGERVITFAQLRRCLSALGCTLEHRPGNGGRVVVRREVTVRARGILGPRAKREIRQYVLPYGGDGRQVSRGRIKELRQQLHLDLESGYDSASFYRADPSPVDAFIAEYRSTLKRLARI